MATIQFQDTVAGESVVVPDDIAEDMEAAWKYLSENPGKEGRITEDDAASLRKYLRYARIYLAKREDGAVTLRGLPSKHLPEGVMRFKLTPSVDEELSPTG